MHTAFSMLYVALLALVATSGLAATVNTDGNADPPAPPGTQVNEAHCGTTLYPHSCWKYTDYPKWCWIQPDVTCYSDKDCDGSKPCYAKIETSDAKVETSDAKVETTNAKVEPAEENLVTIDSNGDPPAPPGTQANEAHCGTTLYPHSCWKYTDYPKWCWIQPTVTCYSDKDCDGTQPCYAKVAN